MILPGKSEDEINESIAQLQQTIPKYEQLSMAIGGYVTGDSHDIREALRKADERMYEDKRSFYAKHPEMVRRPS